MARRMCYVAQRPSAAVVGSGFYLALVVAGLFAMGRLGWLGLFTAFLLMGCGSVLAACLLLWRLGLLKGEAGAGRGISWRAALRENWTYGRWLVGSAILHSVSDQVHMFLVAALLGLNAAGVLRAMQLPSLVVAQVITAAGLLVLPALSYDYGHRRFEALRYKARLVSFGLAACALAFAAGLEAFSPRIEHLLFGGKYAGHAWLMPLLALVPAANSLSMGYSMALRAARKPQFDLMANAIAAPTAALAGFLLIRWWGLGGAATSVVLSFAVLSAVSLIFYRRTAFGVAEVLPREVR
jgi:O-antigen/teichoic acid export membrane protein